MKITGFGRARIISELQKVGIKGIRRQTIRNILIEDDFSQDRNVIHILNLATCVKLLRPVIRMKPQSFGRELCEDRSIATVAYTTS